MFPLPLAGLAAAGRILFSKYNVHPQQNKREVQLKARPTKKLRFKIDSIGIHNPLASLLKTVRTTLEQGLKKTDYDAVIKRFIPSGAEISVPQYPVGARYYQLADLDGDSFKEVIVSYKRREEITTIILRQNSDSWHKAAEIEHPGYTALHYRGISALSNEGGKQLLLGMAGNGKSPNLFAYSMKNNNLQALFNRNYDMLDLVGQDNKRNGESNQQLVLWERNSEDSYDIDILRLKNNKPEASENTNSYYKENVIPYYLSKIRTSPYAPPAWYNLADALVRLKAYGDAKIAIDIGKRLDVNSAYSERFDALKSKIKD